MSYNRPKVAGLDDETGEPLVKRPDDNPVSRSRPLTFELALNRPRRKPSRAA